MKTFDHIAIIFNPNSTGDAPAMATELQKQITSKYSVIGIKPTLSPTEHAGHAIELAESISMKYSRPLIISVSGDGGYNEVVNGAMNAKAKRDNLRPVVAVAGAGNANDHRRVMRDAPLIHLITKAEPKPMDLIRITAQSSDTTFGRYAHSYIGFGISPQVAVELNRNELNRFRESLIALKTFLAFKPFSVSYKGSTRTLDSLIFANINEMAKILKFKDKLEVNDNRFEVVEFAHAGKLLLLFQLLKAAIVGLKDQPQFESYAFQISGTTKVQLDGEVDAIPIGADITIQSVPDAIESLYE